MLGVVLSLLLAAPEQSFEPAGPIARAPGYTADLSVASSGSLALAVWVAGGRWGVGGNSIYAGRVDAAGQALDREGLLISARSGSAPSAAWLASENAFIVAWEDEGQVFVRLVGASGAFHPSTLMPLRLGPGRRPFVTAANPHFMVTAESSVPVMWRFLAPATQLDLTPVALSAHALSSGTAVRGAAMSGNLAMVSWLEGMSLMASVVSIDPAGPAPTSLPVLITSPVPVGSRLRARMTLLKVEPVDKNGSQLTWAVSVEREGIAKPVCVAESIARAYP